MTNPLDVCVIIPVKNRAALLERTLQNVLAQSLPPAEVIVVDDRSEDHVADVVAAAGPTVRMVTNRATGPAAARNTGYLATTAPLVQFFDSDDLITKDKLKAHAEALLSAKADMAYGPYVKAQEEAPGKWKQADVIMQARPLPSPDLEKWILRGWNALTQSMMFTRSFLERVPLWDEAHMPNEDYLYMDRLARQKPRLVHVPAETVIYRQHGRQITGDQIKEQGKTLDAYLVMQKIWAETDWSAQDWLTRTLFEGRLYVNEQFCLSIGALQGAPVHKNKSKKAVIARALNKFERILTSTDWERMHGVSGKPEDFARVVQNVA